MCRPSQLPPSPLLWALMLLASGWPGGGEAVRAEARDPWKSAAGLAAQASPEPTPQPMFTEVQAWFDAAIAAYRKGKAAEALRLQRQVLAWLQANRMAPVVFRAQAWINLGAFLSGTGQGQEALAANQEAVRILRQLPGSSADHQRSLALALSNLGLRYSELGRPQEALAPTQESVAINRARARTDPGAQKNLAISLNNLGIRLRELGRRQEALAPSEEAAAILRELARTDPGLQNDLAASLTNLGSGYSLLGRWQEALAPVLEAVAIRRALAGANPLLQRDLADSLNNLSVHYSQLGRRQEALAPVQEAVAIGRALARANPVFLGDLARSLSTLGVSYSELGRRQEALAPMQESLAIYRELAQTDPAFLNVLADSLNNLGLGYSNLGRRQEALAPMQESVAIYRELAQSNPAFQGDLARSLGNLGGRLSALGRRQEALAPTQEALLIYRGLAKSNPAFLRNLADSLISLSERHGDLGRSPQALVAAQEAVAIHRGLVRNSPGFLSDLASSLNSLGNSYSELGRHRDALAATQEALLIYRGLAKSNPAFLQDLAGSLNNLGLRYSALGRRSEALAPTMEAVAISRRLAGTNPAFQEELARNASNQAMLSIALGDVAAALPLLRESVGAEVSYLQRELPLLPEGQRQQLVEVFADRWQIPFSQADTGAEGAQLALFTRLNRQGLLQDLQRSQALLARRGPWQELVAQITALNVRLTSVTVQETERRQLQAQKEELEQQLYRQLPQIQPALVEPGQIAVALRSHAPQGVLVEFQRYQAFDARKPDGERGEFPRYLALLLRPDGSIRAIPLGEAAPIDAAVAQAVAASADPNQQEEAPQKLAEVSRLLLTPLQRELAGVRELFVSPDGELNRLPFAALPLPAADGSSLADGPTLGEQLSLRLLTTGRDLLRLKQPPRAGGPAVLIANPDFNASRGREPGQQQRPSGLRGLTPWQPLAGTEQEARALAPLLGSRGVISGPAATTTVALQQRAPRILHIATHGFFLADQPPAAAASATSEATPSPLPASPDDPLQRSGLVFAGANRPEADPGDDGYLTAAEATAMDLEGTELVTLSACETGLGGVRSGEGVYGLQRSLAVAGARSTLLSLWKVDDELTVTFMQRYYSRLKAGEGRADALRSTQAEFRSHKNSTYNDIRVWGAFQLSGDWRPLPGW